jgi:electron transfer flavoprotein alpha subunit
MNIVVCIKQVPDTAEISINPETGTLNRSGVESVINPLDRNALEAALSLRSRFGGNVTALTMGPKQAEDALREAVAMGADAGVLCSDKKFAGADTWATACTLEASLRLLGIPDLLLCGKQAIDGDTAQVPAELSVRLGIPFLPYVSEITSCKNGKIEVTSMTDSGSVQLQTTLPAVCSVVKSINVPRLITLTGWVRAFSAEIRRITRTDIDTETTDIGLQGSPTRVKAITPVSHSKKIRYLDADNEEDVHTVCTLLKQAAKDTPASSPSAADTEAARLPEWNMLPRETTAGGGGGLYVIGEVDPDTSRVREVTFELLGEGKRLAAARGLDLSLILPHSGDETGWKAADTRMTADFGPRAVYWLETGPKPGFEANRCAAAAAAFLARVSPEIVLAPATMAGRSFVPLVASRLRTGLTADCTRFEIDEETGLLRQTRPAFGGNIMATIITPEHRPQMATVRPHVLQGAAKTKPAGGAAAPRPRWYRVSGFGSSAGAPVTITSAVTTVGNTEDIVNASVIVSGGRGVGGGAANETGGFPLLRKFARTVGGSVGASRGTVEAGWAPYHQQVGQTGKTVQPKVYIACAISGAVQHLVGMHDSDTIIAVNKDPEAPIFKAADYGFVDDYSRVLNKLLQCFSGSLKKGGEA